MAVDPIAIGNIYVAGRVPIENPDDPHVALGVVLDFSAPFNFQLDLSVINQQQVTGIIRTMFIDNSANPEEVTVSVIGTQQQFTVPAFAEGYFQLTAQLNTRVSLVSDGGGVPGTSVIFYNYTIPGVVWYRYGANNLDTVQRVQGPNPAGTDLDTADNTNPVVQGIAQADGILVRDQVNANYSNKSIALVAGDQVLMNANNARKALYIQNVGANPMGIAWGLVANIGTAGTFTLNPQGSMVIDKLPPTSSIHIIGTAGDVVTAFEA